MQICSHNSLQKCVKIQKKSFIVQVDTNFNSKAFFVPRNKPSVEEKALKDVWAEHKKAILSEKAC